MFRKISQKPHKLSILFGSFPECNLAQIKENGKGSKMVEDRQDLNNNHYQVECKPLTLNHVGKSSRYEFVTNQFEIFNNINPFITVNNFIIECK